jgi:hypothetical protein
LNNLFKLLFITLVLINILNAQTTKWRVVWEANPDSENVEFYEIYLGTDSNNVNLVGTVNHPTVEFRDSLGIGGQGLQKGQIYYYRIKAVNDSSVPSGFSKAAYASIPEIAFSQLALPISVDTTFSLNQSQFVNDPDHGISQLQWNVEDATPGDSIQHSMIDLSTIRFITPTDSTIQDILQFTVFDADSFYDEKSVNIFLSTQMQNFHPYFTSEPGLNAIVDELYSYLAIAFDQDGDSLIFSLNGSPTFLNIVRNDNTDKYSAFISGTPTVADVGSYQVTILVSDGKGGTDRQEYELTVTTSPIEQTSQVLAYPTPFVVSKSPAPYITFSNVPLNSQLVLYNLLGEPVFSTKVDSQPYLWHLKNNSNLDVQSGLYFYYVKEGSKILSAGKIVIIR